ncbi:hypothetical protein [Bacillus pseudomycoides]|uniref:hypothetical protein n=1 Tax=Bacillus pseudomycoides TaxID=64104 RepID=UPI000BEE44FA|nr:hypothetical protein [Bacillus pseudomycoides]PEE34774.1 hypothetical protein COO02_27945 [Bacillus pseudomycoides]PEI32123.1 hypothetical protein CN641_30560 [Bacillus pseudomycoides]PEI86007.1 hypothetical protein CN679_23790 [Bacillus pseudomycoides]PEM26676.1 hypothetical protein CN634_30215 [Bacillus pseudomycoides]PGA65314.1 hypothetical protein COL87_28025 [Bacillus pseudomycoides]
MNKSPYLLLIFGLGLFFSVRHGLLIFLAYWRDQEIAQNNVIMFGIGLLLLLFVVIFNKRNIGNVK